MSLGFLLSKRTHALKTAATTALRATATERLSSPVCGSAAYLEVFGWSSECLWYIGPGRSLRRIRLFRYNPFVHIGNLGGTFGYLARLVILGLIGNEHVGLALKFDSRRLVIIGSIIRGTCWRSRSIFSSFEMVWLFSST